MIGHDRWGVQLHASNNAIDVFKGVPWCVFVVVLDTEMCKIFSRTSLGNFIKHLEFMTVSITGNDWEDSLSTVQQFATRNSIQFTSKEVSATR